MNGIGERHVLRAREKSEWKNGERKEISHYWVECSRTLNGALFEA